MTRLVIGLGNPGPEYEKTRHNVGFLVVDLLGENLRASYWKDACGSSVAEIKVGDEDVVLAKPQTFMNLSGTAVKRLADEYGTAADDIIIVHDDVDLPQGSVRCKRGGGHGGHNGLRSIHERLGTDAYLRVRIGVGRPPGRMEVADFVLRPLRGDSLEELTDVVPTAAQAVIDVLTKGIDDAMREYNSA